MDPTKADCSTCGKTFQQAVADSDDEKTAGLNRCAGCKAVFYCCRKCQKKHWKGHKATCKKLQELIKSKKGFLKEVITDAPDSKAKPDIGMEVFVHYTGRLPNGQVFDSSVKRDQPFSFMLGMGSVIQGWDEGVATMAKGEKARLYITSDYGYGDSGSPPKIPGNCPLIFEVELIDYKKKDLVRTGTNFL